MSGKESLQLCVRSTIEPDLGAFTDIVFHRPVPELGRDDFKDLSSYPSAGEDMKIVRIRFRKM